jgi:signal recognition particle subunit SRP68
MDYPLANTYGVRSDLFLQSADDYHRQRHRVNKKLKKLRRDLKIITKDTKNYQTKNKISTIVSENYDMDPLFGDVLLYQIERDLLYAQETRLLLDVHTSKSKKKFLISKYKKALKNAKNLLEVISNEENDLKILEILTYTAIIEGLLSISRKKYNIALYAFSIARCSLNFLYNYQNLPIEFTKELYYNIIDLIVDPALQVAALQTKSSKISDLNEVSKEQVFNSKHLIPYLEKVIKIISKTNETYITPSNENTIQLIKEINWGSYTASIKSDDLSLLIMKINDELEKINYSNYESYDLALNLYQDAINLQFQEMERNGDNDDDFENQEQHIILTYLKYNYMLLRIKRDYKILEDEDEFESKLINDSKQKRFEIWKKCFKLNDNILNSLIEIQELPGISNNDEIMNFLNTLETYFKIQNYIRLSHAHLAFNKYVNALALIYKSNELMNDVKLFNDNNNNNNNNNNEDHLPNNEKLEKLRLIINEEKSKLFVLASYFKESETSLTVGSNYIIDNISKFPELSSSELLKHVAPLNIDFQPVNVKPVLFDIAYNYIGYDNSEKANTDIQSSSKKIIDAESIKDEAEDNNLEKKKGGFFGLFGR